MSEKILGKRTSQSHLRAEFDLLADEYYEQHRVNISSSGETPEYFAEYKIRDLARFIELTNASKNEICDFGSGIGNSIPFFRKYFSNSNLNCVEVSERSLEISKLRFPGNEKYLVIEDQVGLPSNSQDIVFSACVFHHIPPREHLFWLSELYRITKPGGCIAIFEHNPFNPLTVKAVNTCPFDVNAHLIAARTLRKEMFECDWRETSVSYKIFFPSALKFLRKVEGSLSWLPLGAQYLLTAKKL